MAIACCSSCRSAERPELSLSVIQDQLSSFCLAMESKKLTAAYSKLLFLYLKTGQRDKLIKIARFMRVKEVLNGVYPVDTLEKQSGSNDITNENYDSMIGETDLH